MSTTVMRDPIPEPIAVNGLEMFSLQGKVALVTGSTKGIGKSIARAFTAAGARVYLHGRARREGEDVAQELDAIFLPADLADTSQVERLAGDLAAAEDRLDILVNNAGFETHQTLEHLDLDMLERIARVNYSAPVQLTHLLLPMLRRSDSASIINVTSIHDRVPVHGNGPYASAKAALAMFTRTAAIELAPEGIRVNTLAPGAIETDMNRGILDEIGRRNFAEWIPLGRVGHEDEMMGPAIFLASQASSYVTGATLVADGAYSDHLVRYRTSDTAK